MAKDRLPDKLAVILHADVAGSTELVHQDKQLAHERIQDSFQRFSNAIAKYHGQVLELRGDALLASFERGSDAVTAALAFQADHSYQISHLQDDLLPLIRVGISIGEIVIADNTVTGTGVVQAQRVEQHAEPGGVCISAPIHESLSKRMPFEFVSLGEKELKGFNHAVHVYRVELVSGQSVPAPTKVSNQNALPGNRKLITALVAVILVVTAGTAYWFKSQEPKVEAASIERMAFPLPDKPSIAVLPFINMSGVAEQEYFADGMTENLITDLSKISGLFVIASNSSFSYKGKHVKVQKVAEDLSVRYVMEGSVQRVGNQVRINAQLIDATTGGHLWAERYDGSLRDIFALQDQVTQQIVTALRVNLTGEELALQAIYATDNAEAHDAFLQGMAHYKIQTPESFTQAIPLFEQALISDPDYSDAHAVLASLYWAAFQNDWTFTLGIPSFDANRLANYHLEEALKAPTPMAHALKSKVTAASGYYQSALIEAKKGLKLDPNDATALEGIANVQILLEMPDEAFNSIRNAMRLDPHYPPTYLLTLGRSQFALEQYVDAAETFRRATQRHINSDMPWIYLAASYGHMARLKEGNAAIEAANELRNKAGMIDVSLRDLPYHRESDFSHFGGVIEQIHVRAGLAELPSLMWTSLVTAEGAEKFISHAFRPPSFNVKGATKIDVTTARSLLEKGIQFIDVRIDYLPEEGRIPGAVHLPETRPSNKSGQRLSEKALMGIVDKTDEIVFYCEEATCYHAAFASAKAIAWGYRKTLYFAEGLEGWKQAGFPIAR